MPVGNTLTFLQLGVVVLLLPRGKPAQTAVEDALGKTAPAPVEEIGDREDVLGDLSGGTQGLCTPPAEVVAVVT